MKSFLVTTLLHISLFREAAAQQAQNKHNLTGFIFG
jgi:hypothetical protein